ncbi:MAG: tRNA(Ile)-lysidine synthase [Acidobacteriota bacterium]|jgi:tRNA(Ile)-lysidine synthase|nr:tRNA(Ile)-lysidine synthase [Acidobacteriota bacterium]
MVRAAVRHFFVKQSLPPCRILVAVSGGVDSTALLVGLVSLREDGFEVVAAHVNHHLRGAESNGDETFVRDLCGRIGVPLRIRDGSLDPSAVQARGVEAAAREVRYRCLMAAREGAGARYIATAHQQNDQAETVLMRLVTGSGLAGMRGILPVREDGVIRPLLDVCRAEIDAFLTTEGITARHDRSNDDQRYLRNRVRARVAGDADCAPLAAVAAEARRWWSFGEQVLDSAERTYVAVGATEVRFRPLPNDPWLRQSLLHRHIHRLDPAARDVSAADLTRLAASFETTRCTSVTKNLELVRHDGLLILRRREPPSPVPPFEVELAPGKPAFLPHLGATIHLTETGNGQPFQLPPDLAPHFTVRNRRPGDRFQPLGMRNSKKLKDFLIDRKIAAGTRDRLPLLLCNDEIVWVAGVAVSERFKVTDPPGGAIYQVWLEESGGPGERDQSPLQR